MLFDYLRISEKEQVHFVISKLIGRAKVWWKHLNHARRIEGRRDIKTWLKMNKLLRAQFLSSDNDELSNNRCRSYSQSSSYNVMRSPNSYTCVKHFGGLVRETYASEKEEESDLVDTSTNVIVVEDFNGALETNEVHFRETNVDVATKEKTCVNIGFVLSTDKSNNQVGCDTEHMKGTCSDLPFANEDERLETTSMLRTEQIEGHLDLMDEAGEYSDSQVVREEMKPGVVDLTNQDVGLENDYGGGQKQRVVSARQFVTIKASGHLMCLGDGFDDNKDRVIDVNTEEMNDFHPSIHIARTSNGIHKNYASVSSRENIWPNVVILSLHEYVVKTSSPRINEQVITKRDERMMISIINKSDCDMLASYFYYTPWNSIYQNCILETFGGLVHSLDDLLIEECLNECLSMSWNKNKCHVYYKDGHIERFKRVDKRVDISQVLFSSEMSTKIYAIGYSLGKITHTSDRIYGEACIQEKSSLQNVVELAYWPYMRQHYAHESESTCTSSSDGSGDANDIAIKVPLSGLFMCLTSGPKLGIVHVPDKGLIYIECVTSVRIVFGHFAKSHPSFHPVLKLLTFLMEELGTQRASYSLSEGFLVVFPAINILSFPSKSVKATSVHFLPNLLQHKKSSELESSSFEAEGI